MRGRVLVLLPLIHPCAGALLVNTRHSRHAAHVKTARDGISGLESEPALQVSTRYARIRQPLPTFEVVYGVPAEYALGHALEMTVQVKGRPLDTWPYDAHPDLSNFSWMAYDKSSRVLSGTPPILQPSLIPATTRSYIDIYLFIGTDKDYALRTTLGVSVGPGNASIPVDPRPAPTLESGSPVATLAPAPTSFFQPHGLVFATLVTACTLCFILILGGIGWWIAMRRHLKKQSPAVHRPRSSNDSTDPRGRSRTPRWPRTSAHSLSFVPSSQGAPNLTISTRRRVRTADLGSPTTPSHQSSPEPAPVSPEKTVGTRKRAATLLQTIHTRAIRGSPRIGTSKSSLSPEIPSRKVFSPKSGFVQASPRIGTRISKEELPVVEQSRRDEFTNSWCSALHMDPFHASAGAPTSQKEGLVTSSTTDSHGFEGDRPKSPTPMKGVWGGHETMTLSELGRSGNLLERIVPSSSAPNGKAASFDSSMLSAGPSGSNEDNTPTPRASQIRDMTMGAQSPIGPLTGNRTDQRKTYAERTNQIGMALLATPPNTVHSQKPTTPPLGLSFDSFFSPKSETEAVTIPEDTAQPWYGDVDSERMVRVAPFQETMATTYVTAPESGASPATFRDGRSSAGHGQLEDIGIIGSPSTGHSQMAELDDISSPLLVEPEGEKTEIAETSSQSLTVEYGRADQSLRVLDSFPGMLRGSLSYFPEDVELNTPVLPSTSRIELSYREPDDILLLPEEDLDQGCIRLARVESVDRQRQSRDLLRQAETENLSTAKESQGNGSRGATEDSIISPNVSGQKSAQDDSILSRTKSEEDESADSLESSKMDRSSSGLRYASHLFGSPRT